MEDNSTAELFTIYVMNRLGFEYSPINEEMLSKLVH